MARGQSSIVERHHRINDSCRLLLDANNSDWSSRGGSSAEGDQNAELNTDYLFCSVAIEAMGPICSAGRLFLAKLGRCAKFLTCDPRETDYFFDESVSVAVQRFNMRQYCRYMPVSIAYLDKFSDEELLFAIRFITMREFEFSKNKI